MIYFMQATEGDPIKIGTTGYLTARQKALAAHYGRFLVVLATMEGGRAEEAAVHALFAHLRLGRTEQFRPDPDLMAFIARPVLEGPIPERIEAMKPTTSISLAHVKGSPEYAKWFDAAQKKTHLPRAVMFRLAMAKWAKDEGLPPPPEM